jgi:hypothetical protein
MVDQDQLEKAPIIWDGRARSADPPVPVYRIQTNSQWTWFIGENQYEADGNHFKIVVSSFGLIRKTSAGSTGDEYRAKFDAASAERIKNRITGFFMGPEEKPFPPFMLAQGDCIGVVFKTRWILLM